MSSKFCVALIQLAVGPEKYENLARAAKKIHEAASKGADLVALPECFNSPYGTKYFGEYAEPIPGESTRVLSDAAKKNKIYLIGGSIPEKDGGKLYNTCTVWGPEGTMLAKHRKIHLFDIDVPGGIRFKESESLTQGNQFTSFDMPQCKIGLGICYDIRFAQMAQIYADMGCKLLVYPGAFNMTTGPAHWELLSRGRALDNQLYVACVSPARDPDASYIAWGHSSLVNPWGEVMKKSDENEDIIIANLDMDYVDKVRQMIPIRMQRRDDLYKVVNCTK